MFKYLKVLYSILCIKQFILYKKLYAQQVMLYIKILFNLEINHYLNINNLDNEYAKILVVSKVQKFKIIKISIYRSFDVYKNLMPVDIAWLITDDNNILHAISFDKKIILHIINNLINKES